MTQFGTATQTDNESDLAIDGRGWFVMRDRGNGQLYFTRWGQFHRDEKGYFVSNDGLRLQGYCEAGLTTIGDLRLTQPEASPDMPITAYDITLDGTILVKVADGRQFLRGQILLQDFRQPLKLARMGYRTYAATPAALSIDSLSTPASAGLGTIARGWLE